MSDASTARRTRGWAGFLLAAAVGTLLSMARTGHVSGVGNNMFHLPLLAGLAGMPQFAHDPFIQTLPYYASGFWLALVGMAPGDGGFPLLLAMGFSSRFLAFVAFLACADAMGIRDLIGRLLFVVLIAFSSMMNGLSAAGEGGLFINYFTHSELANATNLLRAIWCAARGRFTEAFACNGVTFFLNAFMAVWNAVPLGLIAILLLMRREIGWRTLLWRSALGLIAFLILAAPVIHAITANPEFGRPDRFRLSNLPHRVLPGTASWSPSWRRGWCCRRRLLRCALSSQRSRWSAASRGPHSALWHSSATSWSG